MKKWVLFLVILFTGYFSYAQNQITFLGIPVDGSPEDMIAALEEKGFVYDSAQNNLRGEYNGMESYVYVVTNNGKVSRISVADVPSFDKDAIKSRYNRLFNQFLNSGEYELLNGSTLSDEEDVAYEITTHSKRYEASFLPVDKTIYGAVWFTIAEHYGNYFIMMFYENLNNQD